MAKEPNSRNSVLGVQVAFVLWMIAFGLSLFLAASTEPAGSGFTGGINRVGTFFRWQFLAFALAIITWTAARGRSDLSRALRLMARIPITIQCFLGLVGVVIVILAVVLD